MDSLRSNVNCINKKFVFIIQVTNICLKQKKVRLQGMLQLVFRKDTPGLELFILCHFLEHIITNEIHSIGIADSHS